VPERRLCILALPHGEESGYGKQKGSIKYQKKATPWGSFHSRLNERSSLDIPARMEVSKTKGGQK
jgi:hypothetical protein